MPKYKPERLNTIPAFSLKQENSIRLAADMYSLESFLSNPRSVQEWGVDFVYASAKLEGNAYTKWDTENLLYSGITAGGKLYSDAHMIINLRDAYMHMLSSKGVCIDRRFVCDLHALLSKNLLPPEQVGVPRGGSVRISGTSYTPSVGGGYLVEELNYMVDITGKLDNPFVRAVYLKLNLCYLQFFQDVNKRTARMVQNSALLSGGFIPLLHGYTKGSGYIEAIVHYYETGDYTKYTSWFVSAYVGMITEITKQGVIGPARKRDLR